eukprot:CAMPEP_0117438526 /NCGR_PEP_ID=MMETSP0759-20121206/2098_1 /TAXON_ID=63605 /ORGANISM="Percolomonas cosmopolitus, Strain WS" /LENGTH=259 /DNA_ID=CAMNT_0005230219 /DNA_START=312 /DNA_END=1092 /DNA_ORIENTATION=-
MEGFVKGLKPEQRNITFQQLKDYYQTLPANVQDKIADGAAKFIDEHNIKLSSSDDSDLVPIDQPADEIICGGVCIGLGIVAIGGTLWGGYRVGASQGKKEKPVVHKYYRDDDEGEGEIQWSKYLDIFKFSRDAAQTLLTDPNPGKHTYIYHYDEEDEATPTSLKEWIASWRAMTPEQKEQQKAILKTMWSNMTTKMQKFYKKQMRALLKTQDANAEDDTFVCGGACIIGAVVIGIGGFVGARNAGKANNQRHTHHYYKK